MKQTAATSFPTRKLVVTAVLGALTIVLTVSPIGGYIPVGPTMATILHVPVIIAAILEGPLVGGLVGLIFGGFSCARAWVSPMVPTDYFFRNPLVSVLPRVLIGIVAYFVYAGLKKLPRGAAIATLSLLWALMAYYIVRSLVSAIQLMQSDGGQLAAIIGNSVLLLAILALAYITLVRFSGKPIELVASAALGSLTNTVLVLLGFYLFYAADLVQLLGVDAAQVGRAVMGIGVTNGIPEIIIAIVLTTGVVMGVSAAQGRKRKDS
jgi:uncharacterized membrane protein